MKMVTRRAVAAFLVFLMGFFAHAQPLSNSKLSIHLINDYTTGSSNVVAGRPQLLKVLAVDPNFPSGQLAAIRDFKAKAPGGKVIVRIYSPKTYWTNDDPTISAVDFWTNHMLPALNQLSANDKQLIDYLEGPNEGETPTLGYPYDPPHFSAQWFNQFWTNLTPMMVSAGYKPCIGSISVSNPWDLTELDYFVPALRQVKSAGGAWSYHAYTLSYSTDVSVERDASLHYRKFYERFAQSFPDLVNLPLVLTEGGVDLSGDSTTSGWQARGSSANYERWLNWFDYQLQQDSYVIGCTLFQNGDPGGWSSFDLETVMPGAQPGVVPITGWMKSYLTNPSTVPPAPTGFATNSMSTVGLSWTNVAVNPTTFNIKRATNSGGPYTLIARNVAEGVSASTFIDLAATNGSTYYYVVSGVNARGEGPNSSQVSAVATPMKINCGGAATGAFLSDMLSNGGLTSATGAAIDLTGVVNPAPLAVYQSQRYQSLSYTIPNLAPGSYTLRLHFAELYWNAPGQRVFNVFVNGGKVLNNFDIFAAAGGNFKGNVQEFNVIPDSTGNLTVQFATVVDQAAVNGIELLTNPTNSFPAVPTGLSATVGSGNVTLNWSGGLRASSYKIRRSTSSGTGYAVIATNFTTSYVDTFYTSGTHYYYVVTGVNGLGESPASNEANGTPTNILADAIGTALFWTNTTIQPGNSVFFRTTVKNQGAQTIATGALGIGILVDGTQIGYVGAANAALGPNSSATYIANGGPNSGAWIATAGAHTITAVVDDINRFAEGNENNNLFSVPLLVNAPSYAINSGGSATGAFAVDANYVGSPNTASVTNAISLTGLSNVAPPAVYQSERWGNVTYTLPNLVPGKLYKTRLHFAEISSSVTQPGDRQFDVVINGALSLTDFDILAAAGAKYRAVTKQFNTVADGLGGIVVQLTRGTANEPKISGLEIFPYTNTAPVLAAISTMLVNAGATITFTNVATDADLPADTLAFGLTNSPAGASIGAGNGVFTWIAPQVTSTVTNSASVLVTDNGTPSLSNAKTFSIVVVAPPKLSSVAVTNGDVNLTWSTYPGKLYKVQFKADLNSAQWIDLGGAGLAGSSSLSFTDVAPVDTQRFYRIVQLD